MTHTRTGCLRAGHHCRRPAVLGERHMRTKDLQAAAAADGRRRPVLCVLQMLGLVCHPQGIKHWREVRRAGVAVQQWYGEPDVALKALWVGCLLQAASSMTATALRFRESMLLHVSQAGHVARSSVALFR